MSGFILKAFVVSVDGFGGETYHARSRGSALAQAWRSDAFSNKTFKQFLSMARCWAQRDWTADRLGHPIEVCGKPAFFVDNNRQYVRFVHPDSDVIQNAHPLEVKPIEYRPETYRSEKFDAQ